MTFEEKEPEDRAATFAALIDAAPVKVTGQPEMVPLTVERLPPPPKPPFDAKNLPPTKQLMVERMLDLDGKQIGLRGRALPGNAIVEFELTGLINEPGFRGWKHVSVRTEPRRGRSPRSSAKRKG